MNASEVYFMLSEYFKRLILKSPDINSLLQTLSSKLAYIM